MTTEQLPLLVEPHVAGQTYVVIERGGHRLTVPKDAYDAGRYKGWRLCGRIKG